MVIILQQLLLFFAKNIATLTAKLETAGNENKDAIDGLKDKLEAAGVDKAALTAIATNIKSSDDHSVTSLENLKQAIKEFQGSRSDDTTSIISALNEYKTTLSSDFGDLKTDLELIATSISGAQARESQFTSIKRLADNRS